MDTEIEVKFLDIDFDDLRGKLKNLNAVCEQPMRLMRRAIIDYSDGRMKQTSDAFIRVRDEGNRVTMTYKQHKIVAVDGAQEIEIKVSDFDSAVKMWQAVGLIVHSLQESKRETWKLDGVEIVLDEWPWLKPYIEIENCSEAALQATAKKLGLNWQDAVFGDVMVAYRAQYAWLKKGDGRNVGHVEQVKFGDPFPDLMKQK